MNKYIPHRRKSHSAGGSIIPTDIAGLDIWLDANEEVLESTLILDDPAEDGDAVVMWRDQSGNNNDPDTVSGLTYRTAGPSLEADNSVNVHIEFDTNPTQVSAATCFMVVNPGADLVIHGSSNTATNEFWGACQSGNGLPHESLPGVPTTYVDGQSIGNTRANHYTAICDGSRHVVTFHDLDISSTDMASIGFLGYPGGGSFRWNGGDVFEILLYDTALSSADREDIENYLGDKWGVTITH